MFVNELVISPTRGDKWRLIEPLLYVTDVGYRITVPKGFVMDLASIPRLARPLFPVHGRHTRAAVVHDWLYHQEGQLKGRKFTRLEADQIFYNAMLELHVPQWRAWVMYKAVRLGGWVWWS